MKVCGNELRSISLEFVNMRRSEQQRKGEQKYGVESNTKKLQAKMPRNADSLDNNRLAKQWLNLFRKMSANKNVYKSMCVVLMKLCESKRKREQIKTFDFYARNGNRFAMWRRKKRVECKSKGEEMRGSTQYTQTCKLLQASRTFIESYLEQTKRRIEHKTQNRINDKYSRENVFEIESLRFIYIVSFSSGSGVHFLLHSLSFLTIDWMCAYVFSVA